MERKYYLDGKEIELSELIEYLTYMLETNGDTTCWEALGIDFEDEEVE